MRNRAKCAKCQQVIESVHSHDITSCECGEILIGGGTQYFKSAARDYANFIRIDDEDREIPVKFQESNGDQKKAIVEQIPLPKRSKKDLISELRTKLKDIDRLPQHVLDTPITHYDYYSLIVILSEILEAD